jgi:hypothetical protein
LPISLGSTNKRTSHLPIRAQQSRRIDFLAELLVDVEA